MPDKISATTATKNQKGDNYAEKPRPPVFWNIQNRQDRSLPEA
jgi:hypothetical protein